MNRVRPPVITGLAPGSGTSTLAAALHAVDSGVLGQRVAGEADVVVCRAGELRLATALACAPSGPRPALAVLLDAPSRSTGQEQLARRLAAVRPRFGAVLTLPHVPRWQGSPDVREEAAGVLGLHAEHLPGPVRAYASTLRALVAALAGGGLLTRATPPLVSRPSSGGLPDRPPPPVRLGSSGSAAIPASSPLPRTLRPEPVPAVSPVPVTLEDLDDEALEAMLLHPPLPAGRAG